MLIWYYIQYGIYVKCHCSIFVIVWLLQYISIIIIIIIWIELDLDLFRESDSISRQCKYFGNVERVCSAWNVVLYSFMSDSGITSTIGSEISWKIVEKVKTFATIQAHLLRWMCYVSNSTRNQLIFCKNCFWIWSPVTACMDSTQSWPNKLTYLSYYTSNTYNA